LVLALEAEAAEQFREIGGHIALASQQFENVIVHDGSSYGSDRSD
jgi:hypothetical protein